MEISPRERLPPEWLQERIEHLGYSSWEDILLSGKKKQNDLKSGTDSGLKGNLDFGVLSVAFVVNRSEH